MFAMPLLYYCYVFVCFCYAVLCFCYDYAMFRIACSVYGQEKGRDIHYSPPVIPDQVGDKRRE